MSIKTRLLLSYIAMIVVPVVCFALVASLLGAFFLGESFPHGTGKEPGKPLFRQTQERRDELFAGLAFLARYDAERLLQQDVLAETDEELRRLGGALMLAKNGAVLFASPSLEQADWAKYMQPPAHDERTRRLPPWSSKGYAVETHSFAFADKSEGTLYFLRDDSPAFTSGVSFFAAMVVSFLAIVGLTNGVLTYLVSRSIIRPLYALKQAAHEIKEGNLERPVLLGRKDELGELGEAFEEIRVRLHDSIRLQLQYEENRKELISSISHDLKTPITGIKACVEAVLDGIADTEAKREKYMRMIAGKSVQMDRLIDELLLYSRLDLNKLPFHLEPVDIRAYVADCVQELRLEPRLSGVHISAAGTAGEPLIVMADREKLHRVLMNIVDNSLKYMEQENRRLSIQLEATADEAIVTVADNGTGISEEAMPYIFDRFYRADRARTTATGGSGLGLAIVRQLVEGHGGRVWAHSEVGRGTSIHVSLPLQKGTGGEADEAHSHY
ncbi:two-component sensor histidine kinase [Brevibacillus agri]|uniref:histidine kinase n=2 Tax=Bacteria TaxID=2 RepID=A0A3M8ATM2_9BACL|nr:HAMP domain-containing sensor histidine kinase [Brevibacillus agri]QAV12709.1 sensor histidine kinase [Brevibacillus agri]RNB54526.1 sensor histidine kinase [Brevibacillus agri]GED27702.1 two-component sensor histidine kinase [Brevibacillus agri]